MKKLWLSAFISLSTACAGDSGFESQRQEGATDSTGRIDSGRSYDSDATAGDVSSGDSGELDAEDLDDSDETTDSANAGEDSDDDTDGSTDGGPELSFDSRAFFTTEVLPMFTDSCTTCHAAPRFNPPIEGPLTIFNYQRMEDLLRVGDGPLANSLYEKIAGVRQHSGGNQCTTEPDLCDIVENWWQGLLGTGDDTNTLTGQVNPVTEDGRVSGWAADRGDESATILIRAYIDGDFTSGILAFETEANLAGYDNGTSGDHAFAFQIPEEYRNGMNHSLNVYGLAGSTWLALPQGQQDFTAYTPQAAGETYFNNNIRSVLQNRCGSCHVVNYSVQWASLLSPAPNKGGTATNNELINKPSGSVSHGGGNLCGGLNGTPCSLFQEWWDIEFN